MSIAIMSASHRAGGTITKAWHPRHDGKVTATCAALIPLLSAKWWHPCSMKETVNVGARHPA